MTPLEHYKRAESFIEAAHDAESDEMARHRMAAAQVHATLANAHMTAGVWDEEGK